MDKCGLCGSEHDLSTIKVWKDAQLTEMPVCGVCSSWRGLTTCFGFCGNHKGTWTMMDKESTFYDEGRYYCPECAKAIAVFNFERYGEMIHKAQNILRCAGKWRL